MEPPVFPLNKPWMQADSSILSQIRQISSISLPTVGNSLLHEGPRGRTLLKTYPFIKGALWVSNTDLRGQRIRSSDLSQTGLSSHEACERADASEVSQGKDVGNMTIPFGECKGRRIPDPDKAGTRKSQDVP